MAASDRDLNAAIAATRFGLGAKAGEIAEAGRDPKGWLKAQIRPSGADQPRGGGETAAQRVADLRQFQEARRMEKQEVAAGQAAQGRDPVKMAQKLLRQDTASILELE